MSKLPVLYGKTASGSIKIWSISIKDESYVTSYGTAGGTLTENERKVSPKNIGRANETTHAQQAMKEATSAWQKKINAGYCTDPAKAGEDSITRRMRCYVYDKSLISSVVRYSMQPKLNGVKCFIKKVDEDTISYQSSGGKQYENLHHHFDSIFLPSLMIGEELDTEIYLHGASLQEIQSATKKENELSKYLQVWAYDMVEEGTFQYRMESLKEVHKRIHHHRFEMCPTIGGIQGHEAIYRTNKVMVEKGYEGSIIRHPQAPYEQGKKSRYVLKLKDFHDTEFPIVGIDKDVRGCIIYVCMTEGGDTFRAVPKGTQDARRRAYNKGEGAYVGKMLTVTYSDVSDSGVPQGNPVAENVRAEEDMDY